MKVRLPDSFGSLKDKVQKMQEDLKKKKKKEYEGSSGGGVVKVTVLGDLTITNIQILDEAFEDKDMLPDLILTACNSALKLAIDEKNKISGEATSGLNFPGLF